MRIALKAENGGRFISRGHGAHPVRVIRNWELIFVLKGRLEMFIGADRCPASPGTCLLLPPGIRHGGIGAYPADLSFFWIHFSPAGEMEEDLLKHLPLRFDAGNPARLADCFRQFLSLQADAVADPDGLDLLAELILHEAFRESGGATLHPELPSLMQELRKILRLRFREPLSTSQIARELQCNPDYLGRVHKCWFSESVTDALNRIRIRHAMELLSSSSLTIAQIADEVGFNDPAYFRRRFFRSCAMTPRAYRKLKIREHVNTE